MIKMNNLDIHALKAYIIHSLFVRISVIIFSILITFFSINAKAAEGAHITATASKAIQALTTGREVPDNIARLPISTLPITLIGTIVGDQGYALISIKGQKEKLFVKGDNIIDGATLVDIYTQCAVLQQGKELTKILLRNVDARRPAARVERPQPVASQPPKLTAKITHPIPKEAVKSLGNNAYIVKRDLVRGQIQSQDMFTLAEMIPKPQGEYLIIMIVPDSFYQKVGLQDGDTIRTINGKPMTTYMDFVDMFKEKSNTDWIEMEIMRAGTPEKLQYTLQ